MFATLLVVTSAVTAPQPAGPDPASLVNPFIGTGGVIHHMGDTFPGADAPFGMVQWSPDTPSRPDGGGYYYGDSAITGFSLTHMSGPGCVAAGDVPVLPVLGAPRLAPAAFGHASEYAEAGYYRVTLRGGIRVQLTATTRTGLARFRFPAARRASLVFNLLGGQNWDFSGGFTADSRSEVSGQVTGDSFCGVQQHQHTLHFVMRFSRPFTGYGVTPAPPGHSGDATAYVTFAASGRPLLAKVGISYVSRAGAAANLDAEDPGWNFQAVRAATHQAWNALLGKIQVTGGTRAQQQVFYTALYHALLHPNVFSDVNGQYATPSGKTRTVGRGHTAFYTNISGWDIYRGQAQLEALLDPAAASDTAESMVDDYAQSGGLPRWEADDGESYVMDGDPADAILADYYAFGARGFGTAAALQDMIAEATRPNRVRPGIAYLGRPGYLPENGRYGCCHFYGPASTTLEYDTEDFALSRFAAALGDQRAAAYFGERAQDWRNLLDPATGWITPRNANGTWLRGFTPQTSTGFVEGDSWKYTGEVPFNLAGLAAAKGGDAAMAAYLDACLGSGLRNQRHRADLGNEPSIGLPWEYDYIGEPYQTQAAVRRIQDQIWTDSPAGLAGNDDLGTMSAWYVWSALGMYPETPGTADLALASPLFPAATVRLPSGADLTVTGTGPGGYVQGATWDDDSWDNAYAPAITQGGTLAFTLGPAPDPSWAAGPGEAPPSYPSTSG